MTSLVTSFVAGLRRTTDRWLFRIGAPEPGPIRLGQRRIYVLPSAAGIGFAVALLVMLLAAINYNLSLGYALVFTLGGSAAASMLHAFRNLYGLSIRPGRCAPVFAGDTAVFHLLIDNPAPRRRPALRLGAHGHWSVFELPAAQETAAALACPAPRRGRLALGRSVLETRWPLGLIRAWSVFVPDAECLVLPAPEPDPPPLPLDAGGDAHGGRRTREGDNDFAGLRAHRSADSPRHVAWKVLARGGPMLTKEFSSGRGRELLLDWERLPPGLDDERRLSRLVAWVIAAERAGLRYALVLPGVRVPAANGGAHHARCLRLLALHGLADAAMEDEA
ncbi:DUF58 domain-containing protein [Thauera phenylacetica]